MKKLTLVLLVTCLFFPLAAVTERPIFGYTLVKYGFQLAPSQDNLGQQWLIDIEIHRIINDLMAVSFELMPFYRNSDSLQSTLLAAYGFVNLKIGYKPFRSFGFYGGLGGGSRIAHTWVDVGEQTFTRLSFDWCWHAFAGVTAQFKPVSLLIELHRLTETINSLNEPNVRTYLMFGVGF